MGLHEYAIVFDYYDVLNLHQSASREDIKRSFRELALKHHPDKNRNSEDSKRKFMAVVEAYEILSDDRSRKEYDRTHKHEESRINREWTPPADWQQVYSYEHLKKEYDRSHLTGGMWDISDRTSGSLWKATLLLFVGLLGLVAFILWVK
ncbi:MAG TPA: DnaJ domain-containing protein [Nitrososphaeraceae archaeon]|nr:DnaJ domain-containing protein [Nitrososphaeraceae archaeon]